MEKLPMCRICLVQNVRMSVVDNKHLRVLYEKLTDVPFVTEDSRPIVACFFCCAKLKQCYRLLRQCLKAEELFTQMINGDYEANALINQDQKKIFNWFIKTPTENISIVDECQMESVVVKEELPAVCEGLDIIIEPKEEYLSDELEPENLDNSCLDVADIQPHHSKVKLEVDVPLMEFNIEVKEEQEVSKKKQKVKGTKRTIVVKKPKLVERRTKVEDAITAEQMRKDKSDKKVIQTVLKRTDTPDTDIKEPYKCGVCQQSFTEKSNLIKHIRIHTGEKPFKCDVCQCSFRQKNHLTKHNRIHTGEKPYKCDVCQRSFTTTRYLTKHKLIHTGYKPYKCAVCQHSFLKSDHLTKHIRTHTGEKPFQCDICQRSFTEKSSLTKHIRIHTGKKPYKCDECQRSFNERSTLTKHIRIHTGVKPFKCNICQCSFRQKNHLSNHIRTHSEKKPFICDVSMSK